MKATLLAILLAVTSFSTAGATDFGLDCMFGTEEEWEEQRVGLGNTVDDFIDVFGELDDDSDGTQWVIEECGTIVVSETDDGYVILIAVMAPADDAFTVGQVQLIARLFSPEDAQPVHDDFVDGTGFVYTMRSDDLLTTLPAEAWKFAGSSHDPGNFMAVYWIGVGPPTPGKFEAVFVGLEVED